MGGPVCSGLAIGLRTILLGGPIVVLMIFVLRMLFVARFLKVLFQLLLRVAAALAHGTYLLRRRCGVRVLVRAVIGRVWFLAHTGIVPPEVHIRKQWL
jgi:hypothetical protein